MGDLILEALITGIDAKLREMPREAADRGRVGTAVVVDHDDQVRRLQVGDLVQSLIRHAARQRAVADDRDDESADPLAQPRLGKAECVAERSRRVAVLDEVVLGLLA